MQGYIIHLSPYIWTWAKNIRKKVCKIFWKFDVFGTVLDLQDVPWQTVGFYSYIKSAILIVLTVLWFKWKTILGLFYVNLHEIFRYQHLGIHVQICKFNVSVSVGIYSQGGISNHLNAFECCFLHRTFFIYPSSKWKQLFSTSAKFSKKFWQTSLWEAAQKR